MLYDILAIQTLYGANPNTNVEDGNIYRFKTGADAIQAVWDAGGTGDEIDASNQSQGVTIDLRPGNFSFVGGSEGSSTSQISIAYQITGYENNWIENATGTSKADHIIGNNATNWLRGGAGDDTLEGGKGDDILEGGTGKDTYIWNTGDGTDTIIDPDKNGSIIVKVNTQKLTAAGAFVETTPGSGVWKKTMTDGSVLTLTHHSPWRLVTEDGSEIILGDDWQDGDFDIHLQGAGADVSASTIPHGDLKPLDQDPNTAGIQTGTDTLGNVIVGEEADPGRQDTLYDDTGNDRLEGFGGSDVLLANRGGDNLLYADQQQDFQTLYTQGQNAAGTGLRGDLLASGTGSDQLFGGNGQDVLAGGDGTDVLVGGGDDDLLYGDGGIVSASGAWSVTSIADIDADGVTHHRKQLNGAVVQAAALGGNDILYGGNGNDLLDGGQGNDVLDGGAGRDILQGGIGNDVLYADAQNAEAGLGQVPADRLGDFLSGGEGDDMLIGGGRSDALMGGEGSDWLEGGAGNDIIFADADYTTQANDWTFAGTDQTYPFADSTRPNLNGVGLSPVNGSLDTGQGGDDMVYGGDGGDWVMGGRGDDVIYGETGMDALDGGAGNDTVYGGADDDALEGDLNADIAQHGNDFLDLGAGQTQQFARGGGGSDTIIGGDTADTIEGDMMIIGRAADYHGDDYIDAKGGNDTIWGEGGSDTILGGAGDDNLEGDAAGIDAQYQGDDLLFGGEGNDNLFGDGGNDSLDGGSGVDYLAGGAGDDTYQNVTGEDTINDVEGHNTIQLASANSVTELNVGHFGEQNQYLSLDVTTNTGETVKIQNAFFGTDALLEFANGDQVDLETLVGTSLTTALNLHLSNSGGKLYGGAGWDTLNGGDGVDTLAGALGNDWLYGGAGNDRLLGGLGNDELSGDDGNDDLTGQQGADGLYGGAGDDIYHYALGDGYDTIFETSGENDILRFDAGIAPDRVVVRHNFDINGHNNLKLEFLDPLGNYTSDSITIQDFFLNRDQRIDRFEFADGTVWTYQDIKLLLNDVTDINNELLLGSSANDKLDGAAGNDIVDGVVGNDWLLGSTGTDTLYGGIGDDNLEGGSGDDVLYGDSSYTSTTGEGNDALYGGSGNDRLYGEQGNDTYLYNAGDGLDVIYDQSGSVGSSIDMLRFGAGILPNQLSLWRSDLNLIVKVNGNADQILIANYFADTDCQIERFEFDNGVVWTATDINTNVQTAIANNQAGTTSNDNFQIDHSGDVVIEAANAGIDTVTVSLLGSYTLPNNVENLVATGSLSGTLTGNGLDNILTGNAGDNNFYGSVGNDTAIGGSGNDWYWSDVETVIEQADEGVDTVIVSDSATLSDNVEILIVGSASRPAGFTLSGNALNNTLMGYSGYSYANNVWDVYDGGLGADIMIARSNANAIFYVDNPGDVVSARGDNDEVRSYIDYTIGNDIEKLTLLDSAVYGHGNSMNNTLNGSNSVTANILTGGSGDDYYLLGAGDLAIEAVNEGYDTVEIASAVAANYQLGANIEKAIISGNGSGTITGTAANDELQSTSSGSVTLYGGLGNDTISSSSANTTSIGGLGDDLYLYASGTVIENANEGYDRILFAGYGWQIVPDNIEEAGSQNTARNQHIRGNGLDNVIVGDSGDNWLDGDLGADTLRGGDGSDRYYVDQSGDMVIENAGAGNDTVYATVSYALSDNVEALVLQGGAVTAFGNSAANQLFGTDLDNTLIGLGGNDILAGYAGNDLLQGGDGSDIYQFGPGDGLDIIEDIDNGSGGIDQLQLLGIRPQDIFVTQDAGHIYLSLDPQNQVTVAWNPAQAIGIEQVVFGDGTVWSVADIVFAATHHYPILQNPMVPQYAIEGQLFSYTLPANTFIDPDPSETLSYTATFPNGSALPGWLVFDAATQTFSGTPPTATAGLLPIEITATDTAGLSRTGSLDLMIYRPINGTTGNDNLVGTTANEAVFGLAGNDTLDGGSADQDLLVGGAGNDTYIIGDMLDQIVEQAGEGTDLIKTSLTFDLSQYANIENLTLTGTATINATGNALDNVLTGNNAVNVLTGGAGNDTYAVGTGDTVVENANEGIDTVQSGITWTLGTNVENLTLTGTTAINGTGNALDNVLTGNSAVNTLTGGLGNDTYVVGTGDIVVENSGEGIDTVQSSITWSLLTNFENLILTGTTAINGTGNALNNVLTGNSAVNTLTGGAGNDMLDGGAGADSLVGGAGDDTYYVDNASDTVTENANEGTDTVNSSVAFTLGNNIEHLVLTGTAAINGTGNTLSNTLTGNSAANTLSGGTGADTMIGGAGNDIYVVDNAGDVVSESVGEGSDLVQSAVTYALSANVENLTLTGTTAINGTGNALDNVLTGNSAANVLTGGIGNDTYVVGTGDTVAENANEGIDTVQSGITWTLAANLENLTLTGTTAINGTGNTLDNILTGNSAANTLTGAAGNDTLDGGAGNDALVGGAGNDIYVVDSTSDVVTENANEGTDTVRSTVSLTLANNVENLVLTGTAAINGTGNTLNNTLTGNSAANTLSGGTGADTMIGGAGNDIYVVDNAGDVVSESIGEGSDLVQSAVAYALSANVENLTLTGTTAINATGNALDNLLTGNSAANVLTGGIGNDTYVVGTGDTVVENANEGIDTVRSGITWTLAANVENLTLTGTTAINGTGNTLDNALTGNSAANTLTGAAGNDTLDGGAGADNLVGGTGDDTYYVDNASDTITENANEGTDTLNSSVTYALGNNVENLVLTSTTAINATGNALNNVLTGNSAVNILTGGAGNDTLDGGAGADSLVGGAGDDTYYVDNASDTVTENANEGTDTVNSSVAFTLGNNIEHLVLTGTAAINGTGNTLSNTLTGNSAANTLSGGTGADTMIGGAGNDIYVVDNAGDVVSESVGEGSDLVQSAVTYALSANVENLTLTGTTAINGTGNALDNVLTGNSAANVLTGGIGNDTYVVGTGDTVVENANEGIDTVQSGITWTLGANLENLTLTGTTAINGTGNTLDNVLTGNSAANVLAGGAGNDTYVVGTGDTVVEIANEGIDNVQSSVTWVLEANVENLTLTGTATINGTGNEEDNFIIGNSATNVLVGGIGYDTLDGGAGADNLSGGVDDDFYYVDNTGDMVIENADEGWDTVESSISSYGLAANVENLQLSYGAGAINGAGNDGDNQLYGNQSANLLSGGLGDDTLDGGMGADTLMGGVGDDYYYVDNLGDIVVESMGEGDWDTVETSINNYSLAANVEGLNLAYGAGAINGVGNAGNNSLHGNESANILSGGFGNDGFSGGGGTDTLIGGEGNDVYWLSDTDINVDTLVERAGEGVDTVYFSQISSGKTYELAPNIENAIVWGSSGFHLIGNNSDNQLLGDSSNSDNAFSGGAGNDYLSTGSGDDQLDGGEGTDTLVGGNGNDTYQLGRGYGADTVVENDAMAGNTDVALFVSGVSADQLWFVHTGNNLEVSIIGTSDKLVVQDWYSGSANHVEQFKTTDGNLTLLDSQVESLVSAMAAFAPPASGQTTLPTNYQATLAPVIAANWH